MPISLIATWFLWAALVYLAALFCIWVPWKFVETQRSRFARPTKDELTARRRHDYAQLYREIERHTGIKHWCLQLVVPALLLFVSLFGLPIATLDSLGSPPTWRVVLGSVSLGGSTASLVFFLINIIAAAIYYPSAALARRRSGRTAGRSLSRVERLVFAPRRLLRYGIPIAVVMIWWGA